MMAPGLLTGFSYDYSFLEGGPIRNAWGEVCKFSELMEPITTQRLAGWASGIFVSEGPSRLNMRKFVILDCP